MAPFFSDIDITSGIGEIDYEIHTGISSESILSQVSSLISQRAQTEFIGKWLLVATYDGVPPFGDDSVVSMLFDLLHLCMTQCQ